MRRDEMLADAVELAEHHWKVFPLRGKVPAIRKAHPPTLYSAVPCADNLVPYPNPLRDCKGGCGRLGHGLYDATDVVEMVIGWWTGDYAGANIGVRIPGPVLMIDVDPRHGGDGSWERLISRYGPWPECMMQISGRGDGGCHRFGLRPPGRLTTKNLGPGIDFKTSTGYVVMARSIHPDSGSPYRRIDGPIPAPPDWFVELAVDRTPPRQHHTYSVPRLGAGNSLADAFCASASWADVLMPHGWDCLDYDPDEDGARWLHPAATSSCSATIRHGCLFVYSTNTPFEVTEPEKPRGYTKFRAYAVLNHRGVLSTAVRALGKGAAR